MLSEIQKVLDRHFAIGFMLPAILFLGGLSTELLLSDRYPSQLAQVAGIGDAALLLTLYGFAAWFLAVCLMAINRSVVRFLEGYGFVASGTGIVTRFPLLRLQLRHVRRFLTLTNRRDALERDLGAGNNTIGPELGRVVRTLATEYPSKEALVLPTRLGNVMRAFEEYSSVMYGFDLIPGWYRLNAVVPKEYSESMREARSHFDFWVNLMVLAALGGTYFVASLAVREGPRAFMTLQPYAVLLLVVFALFVFYDRATNSAVFLGNLYKAAVDLYLPKLSELLGFEELTEPDDRFDRWQAFSRAIIFHSRDHLLEALGRSSKSESDDGRGSLSGASDPPAD